MIKKYFTLIVFFYIAPIMVEATVYYVDKDSIGGKSSDTNNGTSTATPWSTLAKANGKVAPGDTVYVRAGVYYETLSLSTSGMPGKFITWQNYPGERPVIEGNYGGINVWHGVVDISNKNYWKIIGFEIRNYLELLSVYGTSHHFEIRDNLIHNSTYSAGVIVGGYCHDYIIDGNEIYDCHNETLEAFRIMEHTYNFMVSNNKLHDCNYIGIDVVGRIANGLPTKGVIKDNTLWNNGKPRGGHDIYIDCASGIVIEKNKSTNNFSYGIAIQAEEADCDNEKNIIRRNITVGAPYGITVGAWDTCSFCGDSPNNYIYNNTFYEPTTQYNIRIGMYSAGNKFKNNILCNSYGKYFKNTYSGKNIWDYNLFYTGGIAEGDHVIISDPKFTSQFSLLTNSPAIDAGAWLTTITSASGSGRSFTVEDAGYFHPPWGDYVPGDNIQLQGKSSAVVITDITGNTITVDRDVSWKQGDGIALAYSGSAPDIGSCEYIYAPKAPSGFTIK